MISCCQCGRAHYHCCFCDAGYKASYQPGKSSTSKPHSLRLSSCWKDSEDTQGTHVCVVLHWTQSIGQRPPSQQGYGHQKGARGLTSWSCWWNILIDFPAVVPVALRKSLASTGTWYHQTLAGGLGCSMFEMVKEAEGERDGGGREGEREYLSMMDV